MCCGVCADAGRVRAGYRGRPGRAGGDARGQLPAAGAGAVVRGSGGRAGGLQPQAGVLIHCTAGRRRSAMLAYAVLRLRGHDRTRAAALVLTYRTEAQLVPAYVRSVERWLATAAR